MNIFPSYSFSPSSSTFLGWKTPLIESQNKVQSLQKIANIRQRTSHFDYHDDRHEMFVTLKCGKFLAKDGKKSDKNIEVRVHALTREGKCIQCIQRGHSGSIFPGEPDNNGIDDYFFCAS